MDVPIIASAITWTPQDYFNLRDYFAAAALQGLLAFSPKGIHVQMDLGEAARQAYACADIMLAERTKGVSP